MCPFPTHLFSLAVTQEGHHGPDSADGHISSAWGPHGPAEHQTHGLPPEYVGMRNPRLSSLPRASQHGPWHPGLSSGLGLRVLQAGVFRVTPDGSVIRGW